VGFARVVKDRAREAVRGVEVDIGKAQEGGAAFTFRMGLDEPAVRHVDDLSWSGHDDMTVQRAGMFRSTPRLTGIPAPYGRAGRQPDAPANLARHEAGAFTLARLTGCM
jgi:hypothetical protein